MTEQTFHTDYQYGFSSGIESEKIPAGLNEDIIRYISNQKKEPQWMLHTRLKAFGIWKKMKEPHWSNFRYSHLHYNDITYYASPKTSKYTSLEEVDPKILSLYNRLGVPLAEQKILAGVEEKNTAVAVDAVLDSETVVTTYTQKLAKLGIIFCPFHEAVIHHPELVQKYMFSVVPMQDNFFATLNSAVFSGGTFVYIPEGVRCPMELSSYFRINTRKLGQFERTLIIVEKGAYVSYLEGCTAPMFPDQQLHAAVVELVALDNAEIKYSTVQNWYPGDKNGVGGVLNFVTKRGDCRGVRSKISWTQFETGSALTWKYPSCILRGDYSRGEFYSVAVSNHYQRADTGTKMIHIGKHTTSHIVSKGIALGHGAQTYRGLVKVLPSAIKAKSFTRCDSLLLENTAAAHTLPTLESAETSASVAHEATTSKINQDQLMFLESRGLNSEMATALIVNGFCRDIFRNLPMEFAVEAQNLMNISLEGAVA